MAAESPLFTPDAKEDFLSCFDELSEKRKKKLPKILTQAAISMHKFPDSISEDIEAFQQSIKRHSQKENIRRKQEECIKDYFETEGGTEKFLETTQTTDTLWSSPLLKFLADHLKLGIDEEPIIEAKVKKNGKLVWHTIDPISGKILENEAHSTRRFKPNYNKAKCWRMTVADFRKFKGSGKRGGNQAITLERFVEHFEADHNILHAEEVWHELKAIGILNKNDRLSANWRALSSKRIELNAILEPQNVIPQGDIHEYITDTCGDSSVRKEKRTTIDEEEFIANWSDELEDEMREIWQIIEANMLDNGRPDYQKRHHCYEKIQRRQLTYSKISTAFYALANTPEDEDDEDFRSERSIKKWSDKKNKEGTVKKNKETNGWEDKIHDAGILDELVDHQVTGDKTEHDHVTSAAILADYKEKKVTFIKREIEDAQSSILLIEDELELIDDEDFVQEAQDEIDNQKKIIAAAQQKLNRIQHETEKNWWTIELPELRHHRGLTYQVPAKKQLENIKKPFLDEANHYLDETQSTEWYLEEIGAFRNLYRSQTRDHQPIKGHSPIGHIPFLFFQDRKPLTKEIAGMFNQRLQNHVAEADGTEKPRVVRKALYK